MPIALQSSSNSNQIERSGLRGGMFCGSSSVYESPEAGRSSVAADRRLTALTIAAASAAAAAAVATKKMVVEEREEEGAEDSTNSSSSSIGKNSDLSSDGGDGDSGEGEEVESACKKGPLDCLDALEEVLPMKKGVSKFYSGKSKSFTSLGDAAACSSIKEIVKPENAYTRKRKNLLAHRTFFDKNCNYPPRSNSGSISKRPANFRSTLALGMTMSSSYEDSNNSDSSNSNSSPPTLSRPPLYPDSKRTPINESSSSSSSSSPQRNFSPWRSFSLSDLQCAAAASGATPSITGLVINTGDKDKLQ